MQNYIVAVTRYPVMSSSSGLVQATNKLSEPTLRVTRKFVGVIRVGVEFKSGYLFSQLFGTVPLICKDIEPEA